MFREQYELGLLEWCKATPYQDLREGDPVLIPLTGDDHVEDMIDKVGREIRKMCRRGGHPAAVVMSAILHQRTTHWKWEWGKGPEVREMRANLTGVGSVLGLTILTDNYMSDDHVILLDLEVFVLMDIFYPDAPVR